MHGYVIRVLSAGHTIAVMEEVQLNDHAAIRSAKKFAANKPFEVWRGLHCIYGTTSTYRESEIVQRSRP